MPLPNFFVIAAGKSGTTSLHSYLRMHPEVFLPRQKEPNFFMHGSLEDAFSGPADRRIVERHRTLEDYKQLFSEVRSEKAVGEGSFYLYSENARRNIRALIPDARFILMLRHPAERAYSQYLHQRRRGTEPIRDFESALAAEESRRRAGIRHFFIYRDDGYYYAPLKRYFQTFGRERFAIFLYEDFKVNNLDSLRRIFEFIEVDPAFQPATDVQLNIGSLSRAAPLGRFLYTSHPLKNHIKRVLGPRLSSALNNALRGTVAQINSKPAPLLHSETRRQLIAGYREDILNLQDLIQIDLSRWLV